MLTGRCCVSILLTSRLTSTIRQSSKCIARKVSRSQNYEAVRGIFAKTMAAADNGDASNAGRSSYPHGGSSRPRGRGFVFLNSDDLI